MPSATEPRRAEPRRPDPRPATPPAAPPGPRDGGYRSIADGELATAWSLKEYFGSLNTVMRLPGKVRRRVEKVEQQIQAKVGLKLPDIPVPRGTVTAAILLSLAVFVVRPMLLSGSTEEVVSLKSTFGVWEARNGKYAGRMFELGENSIAFRTSSQSPDYTWHRITDVRSRPVADSTLFTVVYDEDGKQAEFAFWYVPAGKAPTIRLKNAADVAWIKTPYEPIARPRN